MQKLGILYNVTSIYNPNISQSWAIELFMLRDFDSRLNYDINFLAFRLIHISHELYS